MENFGVKFVMLVLLVKPENVKIVILSMERYVEKRKRYDMTNESTSNMNSSYNKRYLVSSNKIIQAKNPDEAIYKFKELWNGGDLRIECIEYPEQEKF